MNDEQPLTPTHAQLREPSAMLPTQVFSPSGDAVALTQCVSGIIRLTSSQVNLSGPRFDPVRLGKRVDSFPAINVAFAISDGKFQPISRQIHRGLDGRSFWQMIPAPGLAWQEPGDGHVCRAGFVFTLGNNIDHVSYHGLGVFVIDLEQGEVGLRYQATPGGVPIELPFGLSLWGYAPGQFFEHAPGAAVLGSQTPMSENAAPWRLNPWSALCDQCPVELLEAVEQGYGAETSVTCALAMDDDIFATAYHTANGEHPDLDALRQGIWSATKSAGAGVSLFYLAERYGPEILDLQIIDLLEVSAPHDGWRQIRLRDCFNMSSGIGDLVPELDPPNIFADYDMIYEGESESLQRYLRWFRGPSRDERLAAAFSCGNYPWQPGQVVRYRDQDFFVLAAAMDALVKIKEGPHMALWPLIEQEVFAPIGLEHAIVNQTVEPEGAAGVPLLGGGLFLTLAEAARVAALYHGLGRHAGRQLLHRQSVCEATDPYTCKGLPTGMRNEVGEIYYHMGFWRRPYRTRGGKLLYLPVMFGYGGNEIVLLPNSMTAIRFGHDNPRDAAAYDVTPLVRVAEHLVSFDAQGSP